MRENLAVLRERDFRLLFFGQSVSLFGDGMVNVALAFAVLEVSGSAAAVGLVFAARTLPLVLCILIGGVIADRTSPRTVMIAADIARLFTQGAMAALLIAGEAQTWSLALLAALGGAAAGFFTPASTGLLPLVVDAGSLQQANGLRASAKAVGEIAGPVIAGVLVASVGAGWAMAVDAATFAVSAAFLLPLRLRSRAALEPATFLQDLVDGWREFRARRWVWTLIAGVTVASMMFAAWTALGPVVAEADLGGADAWGLVLSALGAGSLAGGVAALRMRPRLPLVVTCIGFAALAVPLGVLASGAPLAVVVVGAFVGGAGMTVGNTVWESALQRHIPPESLSRVASYDWFGSLALYPLALAVWGPLAEQIGFSTALWAAFAIQIAVFAGLLALPDIRRMRERAPA